MSEDLVVSTQIIVHCKKCGHELKAESVDNWISVEPCSFCMQAYYQEGMQDAHDEDTP